MKTYEFGKTDLSLSVIGMGCWALAGGATWGPQSEAESIATVHAALDEGINFFDTAEGYGGGASELVLGRALAGRRHQVVIATKVSRANLSASDVRRACERSLQRLQTDTIDLYQIHWPSRSVPLSETMEALERLREEGKVRAIGVCNFGAEDLSDLLQVGWVETNQLPYSLLWRSIEYEILPRCVDAGMGVLCYSPLAQGLLTGKFPSPGDVPGGRTRTRLFSGDRPESRHGEPGCETPVFEALDRLASLCHNLNLPMAQVAVAWLLHQPGVTSVIAGARHPDQIRETAAAVYVELIPDMLDYLSILTDPVKKCVGPNPDMWQSQSRFR